MGDTFLVHYQVDLTLTKCGKHLNPERLTKSDHKVTCRACQRSGHGPTSSYRANQSAGQTLARTSPNYGDPNFKGTGKLRCLLCGRPYRDHPQIKLCEGDGW